MFVQIENALLNAILNHKTVDRHRAAGRMRCARSDA